jgi:hypothetical protein
MLYLDKDIDIKKIYKYQSEDKNNEMYKKYKKYLDLYFQKSDKKDIYKREYSEHKLILVNKSNPKKMIIISPTEFVSIDKYYFKLKNFINNILLKITHSQHEDKNTFENLKEKYISARKKITDINEINKDFYKEIDELNNKKLEKINELIIFYKKKVDSYNDIQIMIKESVKSELINLFKSHKNKIPSGGEISKIAKRFSIPANEIEKWFDWIENTYIYLQSYKEMTELSKDIDNKNLLFDLRKKYFIIKYPTIEES